MKWKELLPIPFASLYWKMIWRRPQWRSYLSPVKKWRYDRNTLIWQNVPCWHVIRLFSLKVEDGTSSSSSGSIGSSSGYGSQNTIIKFDESQNLSSITLPGNHINRNGAEGKPTHRRSVLISSLENGNPHFIHRPHLSKKYSLCVNELSNLNKIMAWLDLFKTSQALKNTIQTKKANQDQLNFTSRHIEDYKLVYMHCLVHW